MKRLLIRLFQSIRRSRQALLLLVFLGVAASVLTLLTPLKAGQAIDLIRAGKLTALPGALTALLILYLSSAVCQWGLSYVSNLAGLSAARFLRTEAFAKLERLSVSQIDAHPHGDYAALLTNDIENVSDGIVQGLPTLVTGVSTIALTLAFMLYINVYIAAAVMLLTPLSVLVARRITLASHRYFKDQADAQGDLSALIAERIGARKLIRIFGFEQKNLDTLGHSNLRLRNSAYKAQLYGALINPLTRFVNHLVFITVGALGGLMALRGYLSIGQISALLSYANQYTKPFNELSSVVHRIQAAGASLERVLNLLDEVEETELATAVPAPGLGEIEFRDACFRYLENEPLIEGLNLHVLPGQRIAIVGETGAGKTTLISLLMRFYDLRSGEIRLNGMPVTRMPKSALRQNIAMVLQDSWIFSGTIAENIAFGAEDASLGDIIAASKRAEAHTFISQMPKKYDTMLGEGSALSKGQLQLICIARAMLVDRPILILDEATSAVDTRTERLITTAFDRILAGKTAFIIAHRLSTIRSADRILVMDQGRIVEMGSHKELLLKNGFYAKLYQSQFEQGI